MMFIKAFVIGGVICVIGQILLDKTKLTPARILVLFVVSGVALGAFGVFEPLKEFAGSGVTVPIVGFGGALVQGTKEAINTDGWMGILTGPLTAGAGGITVVIVAALITALISKPRSK